MGNCSKRKFEELTCSCEGHIRGCGYIPKQCLIKSNLRLQLEMKKVLFGGQSASQCLELTQFNIEKETIVTHTHFGDQGGGEANQEDEVGQEAFNFGKELKIPPSCFQEGDALSQELGRLHARLKQLNVPSRDAAGEKEKKKEISKCIIA